MSTSTCNQIVTCSKDRLPDYPSLIDGITI
ncbi:hypothetical protein FOXB_16901 [Fusarium oxysporum f. sp. conglutinans Fo5176]|uniref:Uncharacterized protein n=1 Tax=Fusarium oxysporum (strain Fo5176) TaxID=660025 RepID=F9GE17_FUSOF|nr:hypothetical protein FOXB_16901 [Fusarium oxysporum f. sp. conglutinans Fo5176]